MQLVEQHVIGKSDPRFAAIDTAAFKAKNLYNAANYLVRQAFIFERRYIGYAELFHLLKRHETYTALPRKVSNDILRQLDKNWRAFFAACEAYREDPSKFTGRPKLPKYKDKTKGRFLLIYDMQAISRRALSCGLLVPSGLDIEVQTAHKTVKQAYGYWHTERFLAQVARAGGDETLTDALAAWTARLWPPQQPEPGQPPPVFYLDGHKKPVVRRVTRHESPVQPGWVGKEAHGLTGLPGDESQGSLLDMQITRFD